MARISMRNVQKSKVEEYFSLYLSSAAAKGVKDKTLETYKNHLLNIDPGTILCNMPRLQSK